MSHGSSRWDAALVAARQSWPTVRVPAEQAAAYFEARLGNGDPTTLHASDLYLACALVAQDRSALLAFEQQLMPTLDPILRRMGLQPSDLDEVKQRMRDALLVATPDAAPEIAGYSGRGPLVGWLRVVGARLALKLGRAKTVRLADDDAVFEGTAAPGNPELDALRQRHAPMLQAAFDEALRSLDARGQNLLRQHLVDDLSIDELAPLYAVHRTTVARWIAVAKSTLLERTRTALQSRLHLGSEDCDSLIFALQSQLHISLRMAKP